MKNQSKLLWCYFLFAPLSLVALRKYQQQATSTLYLLLLVEDSRQFHELETWLDQVRHTPWAKTSTLDT